MFYTVWLGNEITALRLAIVNSVKPCGPRSSINFTSQIKPWLYCHHVLRAPTRPRLRVTIVGTVKYDNVISGTVACCKTLAVKKPHVFLMQTGHFLETASNKTVLSAYNIHFSVPDHIPWNKLKH